MSDAAIKPNSNNFFQIVPLQQSKCWMDCEIYMVKWPVDVTVKLVAAHLVTSFQKLNMFKENQKVQMKRLCFLVCLRTSELMFRVH